MRILYLHFCIQAFLMSWSMSIRHRTLRSTFREAWLPLCIPLCSLQWCKGIYGFAVALEFLDFLAHGCGCHGVDIGIFWTFLDLVYFWGSNAYSTNGIGMHHFHSFPCAPPVPSKGLDRANSLPSCSWTSPSTGTVLRGREVLRGRKSTNGQGGETDKLVWTVMKVSNYSLWTVVGLTNNFNTWKTFWGCSRSWFPCGLHLIFSGLRMSGWNLPSTPWILPRVKMHTDYGSCAGQDQCDPIVAQWWSKYIKNANEWERMRKTGYTIAKTAKIYQVYVCMYNVWLPHVYLLGKCMKALHGCKWPMVPRSARGAYKARERERDSRYVEIADMSTSGKEVQRRFWTSQEVSRLPGLVRASVWLGSDLLQLLGAAISHLWRGEHYEKTRLCLGLEPVQVLCLFWESLIRWLSMFPFWLNSHGMLRAAPITNTHEHFYELLIEMIWNN